MGNETSDNSDHKKYMEKYQKLMSFKDDRYGEMTLYKDIYSPENLMIEKIHWNINSNRVNRKLLIENVLQNQTEQISELKKHFIHYDHQFCTSHEKHILLGDFPYRTLKKEFDFIKQRRMRELGYNSKEILKEKVKKF